MRNHKFAFALFLIAIFSITIKANAYEYEEIPYLQKMHATAYLDTGRKCKSGVWPHEGVAGAREDMIGKTAIVYQRLPGNKVGEMIGIYEIEDTGTTEGVINGNVIDIWCPNMDACQDFMNRVYEDGCNGKVFVQLVEANG